MPEILPSYSISELPQTSTKLSLRASIFSGFSKLYLGISHSSLSIYSLKSTPRLLWTHAISPVTEVLSVLAVNSTTESSSQYLYFSTLTKYGTGSLRRIQIKQEEQQEDQEEVLLEKTDAIIDIRGSKSGQYIYLLFKNGTVQGLSIAENGAVDVAWSLKNESSATVVFHNHLLSGQESMPEDGTLISVLKNKKGKNDLSYQVRLIALDEASGQELVNSSIETSTDDGVFALHMGSLLHFNPHTFALSTYSLPQLALSSTIQVRRNQKSPTENASLLPVGINRVLLSYDSTVKLVDTKYNTILDKRVLDKPIQLAAFSDTNSLALGFTGTEIISLPVHPGTGSLLESLGKGVVAHDSKWDLVHNDLLLDQELSPEQYAKKQTELTNAQQTSTTKILESLFKLLKSNKTEHFENWAIAYLKNETWNGDNLSAIPEIIKSSDDTLIYDDENDREVDANFISTLVTQIFASKSVTIDQVDPAQLKLPGKPVNKLLVYLLTHPLFPTPRFPGLLATLSSNPGLYRQAVVTAPGLSCKEVVSALQSTDDDTFQDAVIRLSEEFGSKLIANTIKSVTKSVEHEESQVTQIVNIVERMQKMNIGWNIMSSLIDAGGLFAWDEEILNALDDTVSKMIDDLTLTGDAVVVLEEALKAAKPEKKYYVTEEGTIRRKKKKNKDSNGSAADINGDGITLNGPSLISAQEQNESRIRGLLSFGSADKTGLRPDELAENISRSVPPYTIEKLIL